MQGQMVPMGNASAPVTAGTRHEISHGPSFAMLRLDLVPGQTVVSEAGAMVARHRQVAMEVKLNAGKSPGFFATLKALLVALLRRWIGGETFFVNHFSTPAPGSVWLAPTMSGNIVYRPLRGETLVLSTGAYLAHSGDVDLKLKFGGLRGLLSKEGAFFLTLSGHGELWFTSYGGIETIDVNGSYIVDNGHLVGYAASGEGLVCEFKGRGRLYIQTRNLQSLVGYLTPLLPR
jgi:uncharacterized protein (TIGR00266 family)